MRIINAILILMVFNISVNTAFIVKPLMKSQEKHSLISDTHTNLEATGKGDWRLYYRKLRHAATSQSEQADCFCT